MGLGRLDLLVDLNFWHIQGMCLPCDLGNTSFQVRLRPFLLSSSFVVLQELSLLQDRVPAFNSARAVATVEQELGMPLTSAFRSFDREPIAAASLGQVSTALLCQGTAE